MPSIKRKIYYFFPSKMRKIYFPTDSREFLTTKKENRTPPKGEIVIGRNDFEAIEENTLISFIQLEGLKLKSQVLDIGCEIGKR